MRTRVRIRFSFLLFNAILFMFWEPGAAAGFYIVCLLHELGHAAAAALTGAGIYRIDLTGFGIIMTVGQPRNIPGGAAVLLSGPAVNLLLYLILRFMDAAEYFRDLNLAAGVFNLLPFSGLDGGSLAELLISGTDSEPLLRTLLCIARVLTAAVFAAFILRPVLTGL